jgi:hypothetical protein
MLRRFVRAAKLSARRRDWSNLSSTLRGAWADSIALQKSSILAAFLQTFISLAAELDVGRCEFAFALAWTLGYGVSFFALPPR